MAVEHKEGCWYLKAQAEARRYYEDWPSVCKRCEGWGGFAFYYDDTGFNDFHPCPECLEQSRCPRCHGAVIAWAYWDAGHFANCDHCAYVEGTSRGGPLLDEPCSCIEVWDEWGDLPL